MNTKSKIQVFSKSGLLLFGIYATIMAFLYYSPLSHMVRSWKRGDYSYCYLVPFIVLYLLWEKKNSFAAEPAKNDWKGLIVVAGGIFLYWLGELGGEFFTLYLSSWFVLIGLCLLYMGMPKLTTIIFPLCFILSMFPLPSFVNNRITLSLKIMSSKLGVMMMQAYGMSAYREGNVIDLGFTQLQVVDACSGLRYLLSMIVLSVLIAYFYPARFWKRLIIVFSSIPLTILSNSLRIALTGILSEHFGQNAVEGFFHDFEGLIIFMFTLGVLLIEVKILNKLFPEHHKEMSQNGDHDDSPQAVQMAVNKKEITFKSPQVVIPVLLLTVTLVLSKNIDFREAIPMTQSFESFPESFNGWRGQRHVMETKFIDVLDFTDYFMADYINSEGRAVDFYVAYYETQRKGESIHSPASCLRGGGWNFKQAGSQIITLNDGTPLPVNRALIEKAPIKQLSYYWFPSRGRILTNAIQMKIYNFWDALIQQRTDGALVRVITQVYQDENIENAEKRIQKFISDVQPILNAFLPQKSQ